MTWLLRRLCWVTGHHYEVTGDMWNGEYVERCVLCGTERLCQCGSCREHRNRG